MVYTSKDVETSRIVEMFIDQKISNKLFNIIINNSVIRRNVGKQF